MKKTVLFNFFLDRAVYIIYKLYYNNVYFCFCFLWVCRAVCILYAMSERTCNDVWDR